MTPTEFSATGRVLLYDRLSKDDDSRIINPLPPLKPFTFIFWVYGKSGPDRYLMHSEATSRTDAVKRGKAYAQAESIRFIEAVEGHQTVPPSVYDAFTIVPFPSP